jgi:SAM-dependent methyltransferase
MRDNCLICFYQPLSKVFSLGMQPLANKYPVASTIAQEHYFPLDVLYCNNCKNVQLGHFVSRDVLFQEYFYLSSVNKGLVRHFEALAKDLADARFVVDVGSNDGILLKPLKAEGVRAIGVEPSINVSKIAISQGLDTIVRFFDKECVEAIIRTHGKPDRIIASSVFTHVAAPHEFVTCARDLLADDGTLIIEVEYIGDFIDHIHFERFYFDRIFYYSIHSLTALCAEHHLKIIDVRKIASHGGSLQVHIQHQSSGVEPSERVREQLDREATHLSAAALQDFGIKSAHHASALRELLTQLSHDGARVAGYGAPARVSTICNFAGIGPSHLRYIVDDSPLKQNKLSPGTHIPIVNATFLEDSPVDVLIVFAYEYLDDILQKTGRRYTYYTPIPPSKISVEPSG